MVDDAGEMDREQRRAQILAIATAVFAEKGYHDARIDDIVVRAKVARGTFYLYFPDKRAIFEHIVDVFLGRLSDSIRVIELDDPAARPMDELRDNVRRVFALFKSEPLVARILLSAAVGLDADFDRKLLGFYDTVHALILRALTQGEEAGLVRAGDHRIRAFGVLGTFKEVLYQIVLHNIDTPVEVLADAALDLVLAGVFTDDTLRALRAAAT